MTADAAAAVASVDGRRARRDNNRERVVDALLDLYREGNLQPSVAEVADRSGVSHRSLFRYFDDLDELYRVAIERQYAAVADLWHLAEIGKGTLATRVDRLVDQRLDLYDAAGAVARVGQMRAPVEPILAENLREIAAESVAQLRVHFAPEIAAMASRSADAALEAAAVMCSIQSIDVLRHVRELSRDDAAAALVASLSSLFPAGP